MGGQPPSGDPRPVPQPPEGAAVDGPLEGDLRGLDHGPEAAGSLGIHNGPGEPACGKATKFLFHIDTHQDGRGGGGRRWRAARKLDSVYQSQAISVNT